MPWPASPELVFLSPRGEQILKRVLQRAWERIRPLACLAHSGATRVADQR